MQELMQQIWGIVAPTIITVVGLLTSYLMMRLKILIDTRIKNEKLQMVNDKLFKITDSVVREMEQTAARLLREANADGKLTASESKDIAMQALERTWTYIGKQGREEMMEIYNISQYELRDLIHTNIEATVNRMKNKIL